MDGALIRVRLPGGRLRSDEARAIASAAREAGAGSFEVTNRANLQLRGIPIDAVASVRDALLEAGVAPRDARSDEHRNVLASPTAGIDDDDSSTPAHSWTQSPTG